MSRALFEGVLTVVIVVLFCYLLLTAMLGSFETSMEEGIRERSGDVGDIFGSPQAERALAESE